MIDSAADISEKEAARLNVIMIPMVITIEDKEYLDGVDLLPDAFYEKLAASDTLPKTSQITPFRFKEAFEKYTKNDDELIVITISSKLSGTYESAKKTAEQFNGKVHVIDSLNACIGERLLCEYALRLIAQGLSAQEIVALLERKKHDINVIAALGTLEYLKKGGRISKAVAFAGELMKVKPVVGIVDGEVKLLGKAMGSKKGNNLLNKLIQATNGIDFSMPFGTVWSGLDTSFLDMYIKDSAPLWEKEVACVPKHILGATIGTHIGPGAIGVAFFAKENVL